MMRYYDPNIENSLGITQKVRIKFQSFDYSKIVNIIVDNSNQMGIDLLRRALDDFYDNEIAGKDLILHRGNDTLSISDEFNVGSEFLDKYVVSFSIINDDQDRTINNIM